MAEAFGKYAEAHWVAEAFDKYAKAHCCFGVNALRSREGEPFLLALSRWF